MAKQSRADGTAAEGSAERKPYHYGGLTLRSINSHGSSRPSTPHVRESIHSQGEPPTTPLSQRNRSSTHLSFTQRGAPTPTFFATTAISPGHSQPSSRASTPGHFANSGVSVPPSAFTRQSWPRYADSDEPDGPAFGGMVRERRPSRLSLTLSTWEGTRESDEHGDGPSRRSTNASLIGGADVARSPSASTDMHLNDMSRRSRSTLFIVNSDEHRNGEEARTAKPG